MPAGIQPAVILPYREDGAIDWDGYRRQIVHAVSDERVSGLLINGHAADNQLTTDEEKQEIIRFTRRESPRNVFLTSGVYAESTRAAVDQATKLEAVGADALLVFQPNGWAVANEPDSILLHHRAIHDATTTPMLLYQASVHAGRFAYSLDVLGRLIELERVAGIKEGSWETKTSDLVYQRIKAARPDIAVYLSGDEHLLPNYFLGSDGSQVSIAAVLPGVLCDLWESAEQQDWDRAKKIHRAIQPLVALIYSRPPSTRVSARLKTCLKLLGVLTNDAVRAPLVRLPMEEIRLLEEALEKVTIPCKGRTAQ